MNQSFLIEENNRLRKIIHKYNVMMGSEGGDNGYGESHDSHDHVLRLNRKHNGLMDLTLFISCGLLVIFILENISKLARKA